jgi:hypothetical protein
VSDDLLLWKMSQARSKLGRTLLICQQTHDEDPATQLEYPECECRACTIRMSIEFALESLE